MSTLKKLLTEQLRPTKLEDIILLKRIRDSFPNGSIGQHTLLSGSAGIGKCVTGDMLITVRNDETGEISEISILSFLDQLDR